MLGGFAWCPELPEPSPFWQPTSSEAVAAVVPSRWQQQETSLLIFKNQIATKFASKNVLPWTKWFHIGLILKRLQILFREDTRNDILDISNSVNSIECCIFIRVGTIYRWRINQNRYLFICH